MDLKEIWSGFIWLRIGPMVGSEHSNEYSVFIKDGELLEQLSKNQKASTLQSWVLRSLK
jgi:hypothetical protein